MIYTEITKDEFVRQMKDIRPDNFSRRALEALYNYYDSLSDDTGEDIDFDPIAICCEWTEYENIKEYQDNYGEEYEDISDIENATIVIMLDYESFLAVNH